MNRERIELLEKYLLESPDDPFLVYGMALEYQRADPLKCKALFLRLLNEFPDYSPTYYMAAQFFIEQQDHRKAKEVFEKGINVIEKTADRKSLAELKNAYQNFLFEAED